MTSVTEEIKLNYNDFQSFVSALRTSTSNIESSIQTGRIFDKTNIKRLSKDLEHIITAIELIQKYQQSLHTDIDTLEQIGEKINERDQDLAERYNNSGVHTHQLRT